MSGIMEVLDKMERDFEVLVGDVQRMVQNKINLIAAEEKNESPPEAHNLKAFQPVTRLRKNKEEAEEANENPELTFIIDKVTDALRGESG